MRPILQRGFAVTLLAVGLACAAWGADKLKPVETAWVKGEVVAIATSGEGANTVRFGPWSFGTPLEDGKPRDKRQNLYIVVPGAQNRSTTDPDYNCSVMLSAEPKPDASGEYDVIWVIVLDPALNREFKIEKEMIFAGHQGFTPGDLYSLDDAPGHAVLAEIGVTSLDQLARLRKADGTLPRLLLVPSRRAVRIASSPKAP